MSNEHLTYLYAGFNNAKFKLFYSSSATTVKWKARMIDFFISIIVGRGPCKKSEDGEILCYFSCE